VVDKMAQQLLQLCAGLAAAGVAHRDLKPQNILVAGGRLLLIDFGSAAAMGKRGRAGYEKNRTPYDQRYAPPEGFIDELNWSSWDVYSAGMILVRLLFPPLRGTESYDTFAVEFASKGRDIDRWIQDLIAADKNAKAAGDAPSRDELGQWYCRVAEAACAAGSSAEGVSACSIKEGLSILNDGQGVCWATLRELLDTSPAQRTSAKRALDRMLRGS